jgi:hypothetical protein
MGSGKAVGLRCRSRQRQRSGSRDVSMTRITRWWHGGGMWGRGQCGDSTGRAVDDSDTVTVSDELGPMPALKCRPFAGSSETVSLTPQLEGV